MKSEPEFEIGQVVRVKRSVNSLYAEKIGTVVRVSAGSFGVAFETPQGPDRLAFLANELEAVK
jgi:hypothetical protein